jgi:hypothetical protein
VRDNDAVGSEGQCDNAPGLALERRGLVGRSVIKQKPNRPPIAPIERTESRNVPGLVELAQEVSRPRHLLEVRSPTDALPSALPAGWRVDLTGDFMTAVRRSKVGECRQADLRPTPRLMTAPRETRRDLNLHELLITTADGRALYRSLGWETLSTYSTASIRWCDCGPWRIADPTFNLAVSV